MVKPCLCRHGALADWRIGGMADSKGEGVGMTWGRKDRRGLHPSIICAAALAFAAGLPSRAQAGEVSVSFVKPEHYTDIGLGHATRQRNLKTLQDHLMKWGGRLPDATRLEIDVLDVDLAGIERPVGHEPWVRVLNGKVDGPRMTLRWAIREGATIVASGQEQLSDMAYAHRMPLGDRHQALYYDLRMIDDWLRELSQGLTR